MPQSLWALKETHRGAINQHTEACSGNAPLDLHNPFLSKTHFLHNCEKKRLVHIVVCLLYVQFAQNAILIILEDRINGFISYQHRI